MRQSSVRKFDKMAIILLFLFVMTKCTDFIFVKTVVEILDVVITVSRVLDVYKRQLPFSGDFWQKRKA